MGVLVGLALLSALAMVRPDPGAGSAAARLLAPDGHLSTMTAELPGGPALLTVETARQPGAAAFQGGPEHFLDVVGHDPEALERLWVRETQQRRSRDGSAARHTLSSLDDAGLHTVVAGDGRQARTFEPPALALPADVAAGREWSSEGTVLDADDERRPLGDYRWQARADTSPAGPGCLDVATTLQVGQQVTRDVRTWCPGRGVVAQQLPGEAWTEAAGPPAGLLAPPGAEQPAGREWDPAGWSVQPRPLRRAGLALPVVAVLPPAPTGSGMVLAPTSGGDLLAARRGPEWLLEEWSAHPGGTVTAFGRFGEVTVAATTLRRLVGYDDTGLRRWQLELEDVVARTPVRLDATGVVVAEQSGGLTALDVTTGAVRWRAAGGADVRVAPQLCGDLVLTLDATPRLVARDAATGEQRWESRLAEHADVLACDATTVVVTDSEFDWHGFAVADGAPRWTVRGPAAVHHAVVAQETVVLSSSTGVQARSTADGALRWQHPVAASALVAGGGHVALVGDGRVDVRALDGTVVASLLETPTSAADALLVSPAGEGLWLMGDEGVPTWVGP